MTVLYALCFGLVIWLAAWSLGIKAFDAFLVLMLLVVVAAGWQIARPFVMRQLGRG